MSKTKQTSLLQYSRWEANPHYYDYMNIIRLEQNKGGLCLGGGQCIHLDCGINWSNTFEKVSPKNPPIYDYTKSVCVEKGVFKYTINEDKKDPLFYREIKYEIYKGLYQFEASYSGFFLQRQKLVFEENPMPDACVVSLFTMLNSPNVFKVEEYYGDKDESLKGFNLEYYDKLDQSWRSRKKLQRDKVIPYDNYRDKRPKFQQIKSLYLPKYFPNEI